MPIDFLWIAILLATIVITFLVFKRPIYDAKSNFLMSWVFESADQSFPV